MGLNRNKDSNTDSRGPLYSFVLLWPTGQAQKLAVNSATLYLDHNLVF